MLLDAVDEYERVFEEPISKVIFNSFGDNSLNLQLRCFVDNVNNRMSTISNINETVKQKFNASVINIIFP